MSTVMIYAAAFHIFHCFQVFGSICKIKFVMRPTVSLPPSASAAFATPSTPIQLLCAHNQSRRIWPIGQFPSRASISVPKFDEDFSSFHLFSLSLFFFTILENSAFSLRRNRTGFFYIVLPYSYSYSSRLFAYWITREKGESKAYPKSVRRKESKIEWV